TAASGWSRPRTRGPPSTRPRPPTRRYRTTRSGSPPAAMRSASRTTTSAPTTSNRLPRLASGPAHRPVPSRLPPRALAPPPPRRSPPYPAAIRPTRQHAIASGTCALTMTSISQFISQFALPDAGALGILAPRARHAGARALTGGGSPAGRPDAAGSTRVGLPLSDNRPWLGPVFRGDGDTPDHGGRRDTETSRSRA